MYKQRPSTQILIPRSVHDRNMMDETLLGLMTTGNNMLSSALQQPSTFRAFMEVLPPAAVVRFLCYLTAHKAFNRAGGGAINPMSSRVEPLKLTGPLLTLYDFYHTSYGKNDIEPSVSAQESAGLKGLRKNSSIDQLRNVVKAHSISPCS